MNDLVEQQRKHFDEISDKYIQARKHPNHLLLVDLIWRNFLKRNAGIAPEIRRVLEPMCGFALGYEVLGKYLLTNFDYHGFDYSANMVAAARRRNPSLKIERQDATAYQVPADPFDLIILIAGLHHVYARAGDVIANLGKALRPGGYFISFEPTHNNWMARCIRRKIYASNKVFDSTTEQGFEYRELDLIFKNAGYTKIDEVYPGLLAFVLYGNPDAFPALNVGGILMVKCLFSIDRLFWSNWVGRKLSFATASLWRKP